MRSLVLLLLAVPLALAGALPANGSPGAGAVNGRIAFVRSGVIGATEVWTMNQDGSDLRRVRNGTDPAWSPDGAELVLADNDAGLVVVRADGTGEHPIEVIGGPMRFLYPAWSPNGALIAFGGENPNGLYVVPAAGGAARLLVPGYGLAAAWSPDGRRIAFVGADGSINLVNVDGSNVARLGGANLASGRVAWSPDGSRIAFGDGRTGGISIVGFSGAPPVTVAGGLNAQVGNPAWSPDGTRIAFDGGDICVVGADGKGLGRLTYAPNDEVRGSRSGNARPAWQPLPSGAAPAGSTTTPPGPAFDWDRDLSWPWACSMEYAGRSLTGVVNPPRPSAGAVVTYRLRLANGGKAPIGEEGLAALYSVLDGGAQLIAIRSSQGSCFARPGEELPQIEIECHFGALFPGEVATATLRVRAAAPGELMLTAWLPVPLVGNDGTDAYEPDLVMRTRIAGCTHRGTEQPDVLVGAVGDDVLCGLDGSDRLRGRAGHDSIYAGPGNDAVFARDGQRDLVSCGSGKDTVVVDRIDRVGRDCEIVRG